MIEVALLSDLRGDIGAHGVNLCNVTKEMPHHVEIMDRHILEDAPGPRDVGRRRGCRVSGDDGELLQAADLPIVEAALQRAERRVETAVEPHHHLIGAITQFVDAPLGGLDVQCDRLLTHHSFATIDGLEDMVDVELGWRPNDDSVDCGVVENLVRIQAIAHVILTSESTRVLLEWVTNERQRDIVAPLNGSGMDVTDASGSNDGDPDHAVNPCVRQSWILTSNGKTP